MRESREERHHRSLIRHEVGHALVAALVSGRPGSIEIKGTQGGGECQTRLPPTLGSTAQVELARLHTSMGGAADAFTSVEGLQAIYPQGCLEDLVHARESALQLATTVPMFRWAQKSPDRLVDMAAAMSAYLVLQKHADLTSVLVGRVKQRSWDCLLMADEVERALLFWPEYKSHEPLLAGPDWQDKWLQWGEDTTNWLEQKFFGPQCEADAIANRLEARLAARPPRG
jgi:hypothetical protein